MALEVVLEQASAENGLAYELDDRTTRRPTEAVRTLLYRVGREALANVRKHAHASRVEVQLDDDSDGFSLEVRDDGNGFDAEQGLRVRPGHLGLPAMREQVEIAGGRLKLESRPGTGTALEVWLPDFELTNAIARRRARDGANASPGRRGPPHVQGRARGGDQEPARPRAGGDGGRRTRGDRGDPAPSARRCAGRHADARARRSPGLERGGARRASPPGCCSCPRTPRAAWSTTCWPAAPPDTSTRPPRQRRCAMRSRRLRVGRRS